MATEGNEKQIVEPSDILEKVTKIEEARYKMSKMSFDVIKAKFEGKNQEEKEKEIKEIREEVEKNISSLPFYALPKKAKIEELKKKFLSLSYEEKKKAFDGDGEGSKILKETEQILAENIGKAKYIAKLIEEMRAKKIIDDTKLSEEIKKFIEGTTNQLPEVDDRIIDLLKKIRPFKTKREFYQDKLREIDEKINRVTHSKKMQRWVLGTFKNEEEKKEYDKAQAALAVLFSKKKEILEKVKESENTSNVEIIDV